MIRCVLNKQHSLTNIITTIYSVIVNIIGYILMFAVLLCLSCDRVDKQTEIIILNSTMVIDGINHFELASPFSLNVDNEGKIFVTDGMLMSILVYDSSGVFLYKFGGEGEAPGEFGVLSCNFDIDNNGMVYTINWPLNCIEVFRNDGTYHKRINTNIGNIFDIAVVDSNHIYLNVFTWGPDLLNATELQAVTMIDGNGDVISEFGCIEMTSQNIRERQVLINCTMDTDEENSLYYTSLSDYTVNKFDSNGTFVWSTEGTSLYEVKFEVDSEGASEAHPLVWDLDVDQNRVYVLWAQGGDDRGYRVDMFNTDDGVFAGYFYTQTPSDVMNSSIEIIGDDFYVVSCVDCVIRKFNMIQTD